MNRDASAPFHALFLKINFKFPAISTRKGIDLQNLSKKKSFNEKKIKIVPNVVK